MANKKNSNRQNVNEKNNISDNNKIALLSNHFDNDETDSIDYNEISNHSIKHNNDNSLIDHEKCEAFRRIASAEEIEEMSNELLDQYTDPEQRAKIEAELRKELAKTEEEIQTLRTVLTAKIKRSNDIKRQLGITVWKELRDEVGTNLKNIQETTASGFMAKLSTAAAPSYQRTSEAVKVGHQSVMGTLGSVARKLGEVKNTNAFKSFEEKVGYAVTNVKSKIGSRSSSTTNFDEALNNSENSATTPVTSPTIPEDKSLS
ncbi:tumor protein D52 isoform X1 [Dermatophagoides pteronyssinus]|uniref:tumor protein D52 isoform X1 n=1 Tax=Dermatophagoides pteronyssinus TaxID=6956 RepID=UPI003F677639